MKIYRIAQKAKKVRKERKPYKIFLMTPGDTKEIGEVDAFSEAQAKKIFMDGDTKDYRSYLEMGYTIRAFLDKEELERREYIKRYEKEKEEKLLDNPWWDK